MACNAVLHAGHADDLTEFLRDHRDPSEAGARMLSGNLCRCTGYQSIVAAALDAAKRMREGA
jgi:aerobic-type carbon monoxide dehydrogenase small subunit (CoxS/CutS family)